MEPNQEESNTQHATKLLHSKKETALILNVSLRTIDNLIAFKELAVRRIGRRVLIPHTAIMSFIRTDHLLRKAA